MSDSFSIHKKPQGITPYQATQSATTDSSSATTDSSSSSGIGINDVYNDFLNSIDSNNDLERKIVEFAKALGGVEKMDNWIMSTIGQNMSKSTGNTYSSLGTTPMSAPSGDIININGQPLYLNQVITKCNQLLAMLNATYSKFYDSVKANNPNTLLPPKPNNMPKYLPTFGGSSDQSAQGGVGPGTDGVNGGTQTFYVNGVPYTYDAPPPLDPSQNNPQTALQPFENSISSAQAAEKNIFIEVSQLQRNVNNAWKSLSSELKTIMAMITQVLNNI